MTTDDLIRWLEQDATRLRQITAIADLLVLAAKEIERLTDENQRMRKLLAYE